MTRVVPIVLLGALWCGDVYSETKLFSRAESFSNSDASPLTAYLKNLVGPPPLKGHYALSRNNIEFGWGVNRFELSLVHRNDYNLSFSDGARDFAWLSNNPPQPIYDQFYQVDVWANQYQMTGLKFAYNFPITDVFSLKLSYAQLRATESVSGYLGKDPDGVGGEVARVKKQVGSLYIDTLDGDLYTDYYYTHDPFFARNVTQPKGQGYSIDAEFVWELMPNLRLHGKLYDAAGAIKWQDLPHTVADATGDNFTYDEDGYLQTNPSFQGIETYSDYTQKLTKRERLNLDYRYRHYLLGYEYDRMKVVTFHRLIAGFYWSDYWGASASFDTTSQAIGVKVHMPAGDLSFTLDDVDIDNAHTLGFTWNLIWQF